MTMDRENKTKRGYRRDALLTTPDRGERFPKQTERPNMDKIRLHQVNQVSKAWERSDKQNKL